MDMPSTDMRNHKTMLVRIKFPSIGADRMSSIFKLATYAFVASTEVNNGKPLHSRRRGNFRPFTQPKEPRPVRRSSA